MKKIFNMVRLLLLFGVLLLASCNEEQDYLLTGELVPAIFTTGFAGDSEDGDYSPEADTRATNNTWTANDAIGVYMLDGSNYTLSSALEKNKEYRAGTASTSVTLSPNGTSNTIYYPADNKTVRFVAYSPYSSAATSANQVTYTFTTQNTKATKESKDFIFYRGTTNRSSTSPTETMTFRHRFSKINITVRQGSGGPSCSGLTMTLTKMPVSATVNLSTVASDATLTATTGLGISTSSTTISAYTSASSTTSATVEAIVAPHTGSGNFTGRTFTFSAGGYSYSLPNSVTFETGKVYNFDITLTATAAVLNDVNISNWGVGEVQWNNTYALASSTNYHEIAYNQTSSSLTIRTKGDTSAPTITRSTSSTNRTAGAPSWLTGATFGMASTSGEWTTRTLNLTTQANSSTTSYRTGYLWLTYQGLTCVITVNQDPTPPPFQVLPASTDGMSNCWIVTPNQIMNFNVGGRAYTAGTVPDNFDGYFTFRVRSFEGESTDDFNMHLIGEGFGTVIQFQYTGSKSGNYALDMIADGYVVWSYHLWVVVGTINSWNPRNYGASSTYPHTAVMDRNLGATGPEASAEYRGLYYQFGRKDPFHITEQNYQYQNSMSYLSLGSSAVYPDVLTTNSQASQWFAEEWTELWSDRNGDKTIYDPCPAGWRVPKVGGMVSGIAWTQWSQINQGLKLSGTTLEFPNSGSISLPLSQNTQYEVNSSNAGLVTLTAQTDVAPNGAPMINTDFFNYNRFPPTYEYGYEGRSTTFPRTTMGRIRCVRE